MTFIGNKNIANFLQLSFENGTFSHAYCLIGASQIGKRTLANQLAAQILGVSVAGLATNPDYVYVERQEDEKTGKKKKEISADQIRQVREKFYNSSWLNGYKVIVLDEAELLNEESGNAFLKILKFPIASIGFDKQNQATSKIFRKLVHLFEFCNFNSIGFVRNI